MSEHKQAKGVVIRPDGTHEERLFKQPYKELLMRFVYTITMADKWDALMWMMRDCLRALP
jgi:hypothetical protein